MESCSKRTGTGVLLVGHGTRDPQGVAAFLALAERVAETRPQVAVEPCFLELAEPDIPAGVRRLVEQGVEQIVVMPLLLFAAGHARRDVPNAVAEALQPWPTIRWRQAEHLGAHPAIVQQSHLRYQEALSGRSHVAGEQTILVLAGRGSFDASATLEMQTFAGTLPQASQVATCEVCFYAMAKPSLEETLEHLEVSVAAGTRIVVQPHLLFRGLLLDGIRDAVARHAERRPDCEWILCDPLGATPLVAQAVWERILSASTSETWATAGAQLTAATSLM